MRIQAYEMNLLDSAEKAEDQRLYDEAREYREELEEIQARLKGDFISVTEVTSLYGGEILLAFTHRARQRKGRALKKLRKEGFHKEAEDIKRSFKTGDRNIVFLKDASAYRWILKPDE